MNKDSDPCDEHKTDSWDLSEARTLFLSDIHLGSRFCRVEPLLALLDRCLPQRIYLVGDVIDNRRMRWHVRWPEQYDALIEKLFEFSKLGCEIYYTPGNHDVFLRKYLENYRLVELRDHFIHVGADGRHLAVIHGDQFDCVESQMKWLSSLGSWAYEFLLLVDRGFNLLTGLFTRKRIPLSRSLKLWAKAIVQKRSGFQESLTNFAREQGCEGVLCGHIHKPEIKDLGDVMYFNTGDWIEHCTAIVEWPDGAMELIHAEQLESRKSDPLFHRIIRGKRRREANVPQRVKQ